MVTRRVAPAFLVGFAVALGLFTLWVWFAATPMWLAIDYATFFHSARAPVEQIYDGPPYQFIYPPTGILLTRPLSAVDYWPGFYLLGLVSVAGFAVVVARVSSVALAALSFFSFAALQGLVWGQLPMLFAAALIWSLTQPGFRRGVVIGILGTLKPQLFLAAPFVFLIRRDWPTLSGMAFGGSANIGLSLLLFGFQPWLDWLALLPDLGGYFNSIKTIDTMITPVAFAIRAGLPVIPFALLALGVAAWVIAKSKATTDPLMLAAIIGGCSILVSPYALPHDAILFIPAAAATLLGPLRAASFPAVFLFSSPWTFLALPLFLIARTWTGRRPSLFRCDFRAGERVAPPI